MRGFLVWLCNHFVYPEKLVEFETMKEIYGIVESGFLEQSLEKNLRFTFCLSFFFTARAISKVWIVHCLG